jgi:hypothetical protein
MIKLQPNPTFEAQVRLTVAGQMEPVEVTFVFRALSRQRLSNLLVLTRVIEKNALRRVVEYLKLCWRAKKLASVLDMIDEIVFAWEGFDVPYSIGALGTLVEEFPGAHTSIFLSYLENQEAARRKN